MSLLLNCTILAMDCLPLTISSFLKLHLSKKVNGRKKERNLLYMCKPPELRYLFYIYYILPTYKSKSLWA